MEQKAQNNMERREFLKSAALGAAAFTAVGAGCATTAGGSNGPAVTKGRIKQSIAYWCFETCPEKWDFEYTCKIARQLGCVSVELADSKYFPILKQYGLISAICQIDMNPDPPFLKGFNNPDHWPRVMKATRDAIDAAAEYGFPNVICFTGYAAKNPNDPSSPKIGLEEGANNCVEGLKQMVRYAEQKKVTLCMEMLNSRETTHPMKGHPGYQGDHTDYCIDIIKRVGSPRLKLLFDVYHVQIMDGDIIRRLHQLKEYIGHVHVAGNPGRGELDEKQEIYYPAVMQALLDIGYTGYVGQEFIPTRSPLKSLTEAVKLCDV